MITLRAWTPKDLEGIVDLINAIDAIEKYGDGTSIEELESDLQAPDTDPAQNVFVADDERGNPVGYGVLRLVHEPGKDSFRSWFTVQPAQRGTDLELRLLTRLHSRALERRAEWMSDSVTFHTLANLLDRERIAVIQSFGMDELRRFWQMLRPLDAPIPDGQVPGGVSIRSYRMGEDDERVNEALNESFLDHFGHSENSIESWKHFIGQPFFRPDLSLVAEDTRTREVAGCSINLVNTRENARLAVSRGWIDIIGVRRTWRRQGLGTALLLRSVQGFRDAGLTQVALGCDAENITGAMRIYKRVGFQVNRTLVAFTRTLLAPEQLQ